jgi:predicted nucleic acid-binding protein
LRSLVLDAGVLSLHFVDDPRVTEHFDEIDDSRCSGYITGVNVAEFYYQTCRKLGKQTADTWFHLVGGSPIKVVLDDDLNRLAGLERCSRTLDLSLADCYALALAKRLGGTILTTDRELAKTREVDSILFSVEDTRAHLIA